MRDKYSLDWSKSSTLTTHSYRTPGFNRAKSTALPRIQHIGMRRKWKKHGAKPRNCMYLNAESKILDHEKTASIGPFKFFQNVNTMEQIRKVFCFVLFLILNLKKEFGSARPVTSFQRC